MKLLVVILNFRTTDLAIDCLESLEPEVADEPGIRVLVWENGSGGGALEHLRSAVAVRGWARWAGVDGGDINLGFTGGNNAAIRRNLGSADPAEYFLLLNSDTRVERGALRSLVEFMDRHPEAGIAGSRLLSPEGEIQASPFRFLSVATELDRGLRLGPVTRILAPWALVVRPPTEACRVDWVSGASMLLRRSMLAEIGLLDEGLFTYYDDVDLCLRAHRAGWQTWFVPASRVVHLEGAASGITERSPRRRPSYWFEARRRFFLKNHGPLYAALADAAFIAGFAAWRVRRWVMGRPDHDPPHLLADAVRHSVFVSGFRVEEVSRPAVALPPGQS